MPDVSVFNIDNQNINIKDSTSRSAAQAAQQTATQAQQTATQAQQTATQAQSAASAAQTAQTAAEKAQAQAEEILNLSRLEITYEAGTETITFTTSDHEPTA